MKKILFTSTAGSGHLRPLLPLAHEFVKMGHDVKIATPQSIRGQVEAEGLTSAVFADADRKDPRMMEFFSKRDSMSMQQLGNMFGKIAFGEVYTEYALPGMKKIVDEFAPDLIVGEVLEFSGPILAYQKNIPYVRFGISLASGRKMIEASLDGIEGILQKENINPQNFREFILKAKYLTYFPESFEDPAYPKPDGETTRVLHPYIQDSAVAAVKNEKAFAYISLGTVASQLGFYPRIIQQIIDGLKDLPIQALVATGKQADPSLLKNIPAHIEVQQWVNQEEVLRKANIAIIHGGSGTTLDCLALGVPIVVVPLFADQFQNADRIEATETGIAVYDDAEIIQNITTAVEKLLKNRPSGIDAITKDMASGTPIREVAESLLAELE